ncbi:hypothetical protein [Haladaptatus salinisoli]|uniref:hypothetical protein n=1 Tax=Haladaptatus salinisoli TaxID=2884876 RepID=UPI001D0A3E28|nr:hypothetical protein [Haladaptatus salinisoli]
MGLLALLSAGLLIAAATGVYRVFSYLAALLIAVVFGVASVERNDGEFDLAPYGRLLIGLGAIFVTGLTVIWLSWHPGVSEYTYLLGLPVPTLAYVVFIWLLPILGAFYYALVFPRIGDEELVDELMTDVRRAQRTGEFPLTTARPEADGGGSTDGSRASSDGASDGGERR